MRAKINKYTDTYYKIQLWDPRNLAWKDIQKTYADLHEALAQLPSNGRIMEVTPQGRHPLAA
jgi:hypothetical protein